MTQVDRERFVDNPYTGQTAQEIYDDFLLAGLKPKQDEIETAEFEIKVLTILMDMELI